MPDLPRIDSRESLEAWLNTRPRGDAIIIAHRAAMRVAPIWFATMFTDWAREQGLTILPVLRSHLTTSVVAVFADQAIMEAIISSLKELASTRDRIGDTTAAGNAITYNAAEVALIAGAAAAAVSGAENAIHAALTCTDVQLSFGSPILNSWKSIETDANASAQGEDPHSGPLWSGENYLIGMWQQSQPTLRDTPGGEFWIDWYQRALDGRPQNWPLLRDVALIDDALWEEGGPKLDARIRELRQKHAIAATANGERIEVNPETGKLRLVPDTQLPEDVADRVRRKILKAITILDDETGQAYRALDDDRATLCRAVEEAGNLPVDLYDECASALRRLETRITNGDCPSAEQDALIVDCRERLREAGLDILGSDPATVEVLERRNRISGNDALIDAGETIREAVRIVEPVLEGRLADALPKDAETATNPETSPEDRADASCRQIAASDGRSAKVPTLLLGALL